MSDIEDRRFLETKAFANNLCGNWLCCNPLHISIETRAADSARKRCIADGLECSHEIRCLADSKLPEVVLDALCKYRRQLNDADTGDKPSFSLVSEALQKPIKPFVLIDEAPLHYMDSVKRTTEICSLSELVILLQGDRDD